jgi:choline-sulfatase
MNTKTTALPHILIFLSDQHRFDAWGGGSEPDTPNLDRLAADGTVFERAYTPCPLCVPARVAFLSGHLPSRNAAFTNSAAIPEDHATWLHSLTAVGYETVLCGRMHFLGDDQRHGFAKRIFPDFTPQYWQSGGKFNADLGPYSGTLDASIGTFNAVGGGGLSPVTAYDRQVVSAAIDYIAHRESTQPLCLVVGILGPHNPYVSSEELFRKYAQRVGEPFAFPAGLETDPPFFNKRRVPMSSAQALTMRAAYFGMVEEMDAGMGAVRAAWDHFVESSGAPQLFFYTSDHGEHLGERGLICKQTLWDGAARVPLIVAGDGIPAGARRTEPSGLLDIGPTLAARVKAPLPPDQDGGDLFGADISGRTVVSEFMEEHNGGELLCRMAVRGNWKLITTAGSSEWEWLFDLEKDPLETTNLADHNPAIVRELGKVLDELPPAKDVILRHRAKLAHANVLVRAGDRLGPPENEVWTELRGQYAPPTLAWTPEIGKGPG